MIDSLIFYEDRKSWERAIIAKCKGRCANCGGSGRLSVRVIVPINSGGRLVESNGTVLCRTCDMAATAAFQVTSENKRAVNFMVSRRLYDRLQAVTRDYNSFKSVGSLIRSLIAMYVENEDRFDDLQQYQDSGSDIKVNIWIDSQLYEAFKNKIAAKGMTITDSIKGLILMYESEALPLAGKRIC